MKYRTIEIVLKGRRKAFLSLPWEYTQEDVVKVANVIHLEWDMLMADATKQEEEPKDAGKEAV